MKKSKLLLLSAGSLIVLLMGYSSMQETLQGQPDQKAYRNAKKKISSTRLRCAPDWSANPIEEEEIQAMVLLPGTGSHTWKINTRSDSAQLYFNQGINLYYGFHIIEALPSFKKALQFDSSSAMLYWAVALSYGPNINDYGYTASPEALSALAKAKFYMNHASLKEKELILAMTSHYSADSTIKRAMLNQQYADHMKALYMKYPDDAEIGTLYADALMNLHPWDFWEKDGRPKPWTPELMHVLENTIKKYPDHPGANHYYIHVMEASPFASKANPSADKLAALAPGLSHMVHMPSHIYIRTGAYEQGRRVNEAAVKSYYQYKKIYPAVLDGAFLYEYHNLHMLAASSINENDYSQAIRDARACMKAVDTSVLSAEAPFGNYTQYIYVTPAFTMIRFEKWQDILDEPLITYRYHYGRLIQEFARGMAYAHTGQLDKSKSSLAIMDSLLKEKDMSVVLEPFNAPVTGGLVAKYILMGTIAEMENKTTEAIQYFEKGVATEDALVYQEPRDWLLPARHWLGNMLLKEKRYKEAEEVFLKDLSYQPNNYISTVGIGKAKAKG
jgi:tetratricopeptide (TPR) repeat protein